jgi:Flp pilus assembly protein TadG
MKMFKKNTGAIIILVAGVLLFFLLSFLVVGIDFAYVYYVRGEVQAAADSASLAGAAKLDRTNSTVQTDARNEAVKFAGKNLAAKSPVVLASDGNNTLSNNNDITVGNWNYAKNPKYLAGRMPINAVQVVARRTKDSPGGEVGLIFKNIVQGLVSMGIKREAIAERKALATPGIPLCIQSCNLSMPYDLILQHDPKPIDNGMAWTAFNCKQAPNLGKNGDVTAYMWGENKMESLCDLCMTTNNAIGETLKELEDAFNNTTYRKLDKQFDSSGKVISWRVATPVLDKRCAIVDENCMQSNPLNLNCPQPSCCDFVTCPDPSNPNCCVCPPGAQGDKSERQHVQQIAEVVITSVNTSGSSKGITINYVNCTGCPTNIPMSKEVALVK